MDATLLSDLNAERRARRAALVVTDLGSGKTHLVREGDPVSPELEERVRAAFDSGKSATVEVGGAPHFINVYLPPPRLVVVGAVHISQALAPMARIAGLDVEIIDPRTAFATPERFHDVALHAEWPDKVLAERPLDAFTALAAVTHDPKIDDLPIRAALQAGCFYVGALGSRKTHAARLQRLEAEGVAPELLARIHAPIGLPIAASTPAEIAVAALAQIIEALRTRGRAAKAAEAAA
jgi:xanthine dehydrogenase accessory factor